MTYAGFRILPFGYFDPNTPTPLPTCPIPSAPLDQRSIRASNLYLEPGSIPPEFVSEPPSSVLAEVSAACGDVIDALRWRYPGKAANELLITREVWPGAFDVRDAPPDSWLTLEKGEVMGSPALYLRTKSGEPGVQRIYFQTGDIVTIVEAGAEFEELMRTAESIREAESAGLVVTTPAPDLSGAVSPEEALAKLRADPKLDRLVTAIADGDVDGLLAQINWQPTLCASADSRRQAESCDAGQDPETPLPMVDAGDTVSFWVSEKTLRPYLEALLSSRDVPLSYVGESTSAAGRLFLGFEGGSKGRNFPPLGSGDADLTGFFLVVDATAPAPVTRFALTTNTYGTAARARDSREQDPQKIRTLVQQE